MSARPVRHTCHERLSIRTRLHGAARVATDSVQPYRTEVFAATNQSRRSLCMPRQGPAVTAVNQEVTPNG
jgi:hypothetical protein